MAKVISMRYCSSKFLERNHIFKGFIILSHVMLCYVMLCYVLKLFLHLLLGQEIYTRFVLVNILLLLYCVHFIFPLKVFSLFYF